MHTISAVAVAQNLTAGEIAAAGAFVAACALILGLTGLIDRIEAFIPMAVRVRRLILLIMYMREVVNVFRLFQRVCCTLVVSRCCTRASHPFKLLS